MRSTQVTTWRKYTQAEKKAYRARVRRRKDWRVQIELNGQWHDVPTVPGSVHFADNFGSRVPTARVNGDVL